MLKLRNWLTGLFSPFVIQELDWEKLTPISLILSLLKPVKYLVYISIVLTAATSLTEVYIYHAIGQLVDYMRESGTENFLTDHQGYLWFLLFFILCWRSLVYICSFSLATLGLRLNLNTKIRWNVHRRFTSQSMTFFQKQFAGNLSSKVWSSGVSGTDVFTITIQLVLFITVFSIATAVTLFYAHFILGLLTTVWLLAFIFVCYKFVPVAREQAKLMAENAQYCQGQITDIYSNISTVKLFGNKEIEQAYAKSAFQKFLTQGYRFISCIILGNSSSLITNNIAIAVLGGATIFIWQTGELSIGEVAMVLGLILRLETNLSHVLTRLLDLFRAYGQVESTLKASAKPVTLQDATQAKPFAYQKGQVSFQSVDFAYEAGGRVLKEFNLDIKPGEKVGLVGRSGAGKSTIASLLLRLYDCSSGSVSIDGQNIKDLQQDSLRQKIGLVTQDTALLHRSVYDNITLGAQDISMADVELAAEKAQALGFINDLEDNKGRKGFDAYVGERGVKLSGGQRQRIALARVFLKNPPILILDEATSALDTQLDNEIQEVLREVMEGKTVLAIAHRLSTIARMDRLIVLDGGKLVEMGSHKKLIENNGLYANLWQKQFHGLNLDQATEIQAMRVDFS
ncbi:ABC transporter ATP-binding protein [Polycladidibacter stylochi]|uniref:ABC transporter ATP-binding protein n=1 Tax=Polycladidibacter stylochi TaxID=1807766 RepID=UPI0008296EE3|nr:ABC transporter ATP-binding protein [Pseudovibrio stylochi]